MTLRLAMWSGPRNLSTAMMRSWGNRADTVVCDEPLYAHYLKVTGVEHPGADEVIAHHESDWQRVVKMLTGPVPGDKPIFYQKHMAHHLLPDIDRSWLASLTNCFLIRDPRAMLTSLTKVYAAVSIEDTGLPQQVELFERVCFWTGAIPPVLDADDILNDPHGVLGKLCERVGVPFDEKMLSWPAGPRETDGIWAKHWYDSVNDSTGFKPFTARAGNDQLPASLQALLEQCLKYYDALAAFRLM